MERSYETKKISRLFIRGSLCHSLVCCGFFKDVFVCETGLFFSALEQKKKETKKKNGKKRKKDREIDYLNMSFTHIPELMIDRPLFEVFIPRA